MDDAQKAKVAVGSKVRLRDGREGNVTEISDNQVTVVTGDSNETVQVPIEEAEPVDSGGPAAA